MSSSGEELEALKRPFVIGVVAVLALMAVLGVVIHVANSGRHRPEGTAEQWLTALGDTTRKGVRDDATKRAEELGGVGVGRPLLPAGVKPGKSAFPDLEVGRAAVDGDRARVPYQLHQRLASGDLPKRSGVVVLQRQPDRRWQVVALDTAGAGERVPSDGGDAPSRAPFASWVGALLLGCGVAAASVALVRWAGRGSELVEPGRRGGVASPG